MNCLCLCLFFTTSPSHLLIRMLGTRQCHIEPGLELLTCKGSRARGSRASVSKCKVDVTIFWGGCQFWHERSSQELEVTTLRAALYGAVLRCTILTAQWCSGNTFAETRECLAPTCPNLFLFHFWKVKCGGGHSDLRKTSVQV